MRILCAMSGGVDSSVAALLLKQEGHEVIGISLKLADVPEDPQAKVNGCCSVKDFNDARSVCDALDIPFYALNFKDEFREKVMNPFVREYLIGRTPNPCVLCNQEIKFETFLKKAQDFSADAVATGHYAQILNHPETGELSLFKGKDPKKDQSYFLFSLKKESLRRILFPVGHLLKEQVREIARKHALKTQNKAESQEICFVPNNDHGSFIDRFSPDPSRQGGVFVDEAGNVLGTHAGVHHFTVGQRRGLSVAMGRRFYVKSIDAASERVVLSEDESLFQKSLVAQKVSWIGFVPTPDQTIEAKIRSRHLPEPCKIEPIGDSLFRVIFDRPQRAIAPGQAIVFYSGDWVLGGGFIASAQ